MLTKIRAFLRGVLEFRHSFTWADPARVSPHDYTDLDHLYDEGREFAHRVTLRQFEE